MFYTRPHKHLCFKYVSCLNKSYYYYYYRYCSSHVPLSFQSPFTAEEPRLRTPSPRGTPLTTPLPTPEYTPPESEQSAGSSPSVATPERTPTPSFSTEEEVTSVSRGEGREALEAGHEEEEEELDEEKDRTLSVVRFVV